jgi:hypothetical protein
MIIDYNNNIQIKISIIIIMNKKEEEQKTSVKLDTKQRKLLSTLDKESKWKDVKSIPIINNELEGLDIDEDFIGLGCSRYLNEASEAGKLDVEEMFRNCREAEKVRQRTKKKEKREQATRAKKGRSGKGTNNNKLLTKQDVVKNDSKLNEDNKNIIKRIKSTADKISDIISKSDDPKEWKDELLTLGLKVGFDTLTSLIISVAETYPNLFKVSGSIFTLTAGVISFLAKTYGIIETGEMLGINYLLRKLKALIGWLKRNGLEGLITRENRGGDDGSGGGGGGYYDDDDDGGKPPPPSRRDEGGMDFVLMLDADKLRELLEQVDVVEGELDETPSQNQLAIVPYTPPQSTPQQNDIRSQLNQVIQESQRQHELKAEADNRQRALERNPDSGTTQTQYTGQSELQTETPPITRERMTEEMGQGEKVKDVKGEEMGSKSSDLTGQSTLNKRPPLARNIIGTALSAMGVYSAFNSMMGNAPIPQDIPEAPVIPEPPEIVQSEPPQQGNLRVEGDLHLLQGGRQQFPGEGRGFRDSLVNNPQQPSTSQSGNLLQPRQNVNLEIRDLGMDGPPLDRTNTQPPRHTLTRLNERVGGVGSSRNLDLMERKIESSEGIIKGQQTQLEQEREKVAQRDDEIRDSVKEQEELNKSLKKSKEMIDKANREKQQREQDVSDYVAMMGRNQDALGSLLGMPGGQGKNLEELTSLQRGVGTMGALSGLQNTALSNVRNRVDLQEQNLLNEVEEQARITQQNAERGMSEVMSRLTQTEAERDRQKRLFEAEQEVRQRQGMGEFMPREGRGREQTTLLNVIIGHMMGLDTAITSRPTREQVNSALPYFLEEYTSLNREQIRELLTDNNLDNMSSTQLNEAQTGNRVVRNILTQLRDMDRDRREENEVSIAQGNMPRRNILLTENPILRSFINRMMREIPPLPRQPKELQKPPRQPKELQKTPINFLDELGLQYDTKELQKVKIKTKKKSKPKKDDKERDVRGYFEEEPEGDDAEEKKKKKKKKK